MRHKLRDSQGLTLVEMLCATLILIMLALLIGSGTHMATDNYRRMVLRSEMEILRSNLCDALADELRYASDIEVGADGALTSYRSGRYGEKTSLGVQTASGKRKGMVTASNTAVGEDPFLVVSSGSYGGETWAGGVDELKITYASGIFTVKLKLREMRMDGDDNREFVTNGLELLLEDTSVRCLNPKPPLAP